MRNASNLPSLRRFCRIAREATAPTRARASQSRRRLVSARRVFVVRSARTFATIAVGEVSMRTGLFLILGALAFTGCAHTGDVVELTPMSAKVSAFASVGVAVDSQGIANNAEKDETQLRNALIARLKDAQLFSQTVDDPLTADMIIRATITKVDGGDSLSRGLGVGGEAQVEVTVQFQNKQKQPIGKLSAMGNSSKNVHMRVGGIDTSAVEDVVGRALDNAAGQIVDYMRDRR
jgi:hypothetical protein